MKTIREAIARGAKEVYCNNGLIIKLPDRYCRLDECMFPPKMIQGKPVFRWVFIDLHKKQDSDISAVKHRSLYVDGDFCYFHENEYLAKEREVNELISDNGGIDKYRTTYWIDDWMYV